MIVEHDLSFVFKGEITVATLNININLKNKVRTIHDK